MAFKIAFLGLVGPDGNDAGGRVWKYATEDSLATCDTVGYFNDATSLLRPGDKIDVAVVSDDTADPYTVSDYGALIVLTNAAGIVDTSNETAFVITDSD